MDEYLYKYLVLHRKLSIPQLGILTLDNEPARYNEASGQLFPPKPLIVFEENTASAPDRSFFEFLAEEMGADDETVTKSFNEFSDQLCKDIREQHAAVLKELGRFEKRDEGTVLFTPEVTVLDLFPIIRVQADKEVLEVVVETTNEPDDYWWYYAIILLIIGAGALIYYYV